MGTSEGLYEPKISIKVTNISQLNLSKDYENGDLDYWIDQDIPDRQ